MLLDNRVAALRTRIKSVSFSHMRPYTHVEKYSISANHPRLVNINNKDKYMLTSIANHFAREASQAWRYEAHFASQSAADI